MSAIYQNELLELTPQYFQVLEQEFNKKDDTQQPTVISDEEYLDKLLARWELPEPPTTIFYQKEVEDEWESYYENERLESDLLEAEESQMI